MITVQTEGEGHGKVVVFFFSRTHPLDDKEEHLEAADNSLDYQLADNRKGDVYHKILGRRHSHPVTA
jgi:hypothetical protein